MTSQFVPTVTDMVTIVSNIIDGYGMGPIRALAQEPVQNSKDAARGRAHVQYRLHRHRSRGNADVLMLTVTDSNTTGLRGPVLSFDDIKERGNILKKDENWAAFEGMGYTKEDDNALGSRGQGKAAFLYHSRLPRLPASVQGRMMILYDTLLPGDEYRLGVRYASPFDTVLKAPFRGDQARQIVSSRYTSEDGTKIELGLEPLTSVGTRIIVPYLSEEAVAAFHSGEFYQWLQRCWWRAVQIGLTIDVVDEHGTRQSVAVPSWWSGEPWKRRTQGVKVHNDLDVNDDCKVKRMVFLYDESLHEPDIDGAGSQFRGVQLLRGQQWIETLGPEIFDYIPRDKRPGFRGFVEFDRATERDLRRAESPQHERFDRRVSGVKAIIAAIESKVREFAEEQGWSDQESTRPAPESDREVALDFLRFLSPRGRPGSNSTAGTGQLELNFTERWECDLQVGLPTSQSTRVDWGQTIRNVVVMVKIEPPAPSQTSTVSLELTRVGGNTPPTVVATQRVGIQNGEGIAEFGDFQIITGKPSPGRIQCSQNGKWKLTARVRASNAEVARSSRSIFVNEDPPPRSSKPYTLSISVENHSARQRRINNNDTIGVQISVTNHTASDQLLELNASLGDLLLADRKQLDTKGVPAGATPVRIAGVQSSIVVNPNATDTTSRLHINLPPGRHALRADLYLDEEVIAHATRSLDVEVDPVQPQDWPPFEIEQVSGAGPLPRWQFYKRGSDDWVLQYPPAYPLYRALGSSQGRDGTQLSGISAFVVDICAEGIIEWALDPLDSGDSSRLDMLLASPPTGADPDRWEEYCEKMRELGNLRTNHDQVDQYGQMVRECVARSLSLFEERT